MVCQEYCIILLCTAQVAEGLRGTPLQVHISGGCSSTRYTPQSWFERLGTETQDFGQLWSLKVSKSQMQNKSCDSLNSLLDSYTQPWPSDSDQKNISKNSSPWHNGWVHRALVRQRHIASRPGSARREVFVVSLSHCVSFASRLHPHGSPNEGETHSLCLEGVLSSRTWQKSSWNFQLGKESERNLRRKWASLFFYKEYEIISPWVFSRFLSHFGHCLASRSKSSKVSLPRNDSKIRNVWISEFPMRSDCPRCPSPRRSVRTFKRTDSTCTWQVGKSKSTRFVNIEISKTHKRIREGRLFHLFRNNGMGDAGTCYSALHERIDSDRWEIVMQKNWL